MKVLEKGQYFGQSNFVTSFGGITITDTEYTHDYVDWHRHENPYFTLLLQGKLFEENKKNAYFLTQGSLLFHNWQDSHRNKKPAEFTRGAHLEISSDWMQKFDLSKYLMEGSIKVKNPSIKNLLYQILIESRISDPYNQTSVELLAIEILSLLQQDISPNQVGPPPKWLSQLEELIYENREENITLKRIAQELNLHPVHISRTFHKYNRLTFGKYCREIRLNKAITAIQSKKYSMTDVAYLGHYYDQSHMITAFKEKFKLTPRQYAKLLG